MSELPPPLPPVALSKKKLPVIVWVVIALAVGLSVVGLLATLGFVGGKKAINKAKRMTALAAATQLETTINQFYAEYSALPNPGSSKLSHDLVLETAGPEGQQLLSIVMGKETNPLPQNSKKLQLFIGRPGAGGKNGLITLPSGLSELKDPWGNPYQVVIDGDYDENLTPPADSGSPAPVHGRRVLVYSLGQDGKGGAGAICTW